jgi:hypothetical protein
MNKENCRKKYHLFINEQQRKTVITFVNVIFVVVAFLNKFANVAFENKEIVVTLFMKKLICRKCIDE